MPLDMPSLNTPPDPGNAGVPTGHGAQPSATPRRAFVVSARVVLIVLFAIAWEGAARLNWIDPFFFSMPSLIVLQLYHWLSEGTPQGPLLAQMRLTFEAAAVGFVIGTIAGASCAFAFARNWFVADVLGFYIKLAKVVPLMVLGAFLVIALGLGMASKVALAALMAFVIVCSHAHERVRDANREPDIEASARESAMTSVLNGTMASLRQAFALALVAVLVGEFLGARRGIGTLIAASQAEFNVSGVFAATIALGAVALLADALLAALQAWWLKRRQRT